MKFFKQFISGKNFCGNFKDICGKKESEYAPCVHKTKADQLFMQCCMQYIPNDCHILCKYEVEEVEARQLVSC